MIHFTPPTAPDGTDFLVLHQHLLGAKTTPTFAADNQALCSGNLCYWVSSQPVNTSTCTNLLIFQLLFLEQPLQIFNVIVLEVFEEAARRLKAFLDGEACCLIPAHAAEHTNCSFTSYNTNPTIHTDNIRIFCGEFFKLLCKLVLKM